MRYTGAGGRAVLSLLTAALLAAACGKKGPLYLPEEARTSAAPAAIAAAPPGPQSRDDR